MSDEIPRDARDFPPGTQIAGYRLEEEIGRGGMAVVYRAHDVRLDRRVALKILTPGLAGDQAFRQRFIRESRAAAAVDHPNIIPIFEAGEFSGVLFIAMRYVQGRDLRTLLDREGTLPAAHVAYIIAQMASALDAAHARGLVHRDVKPANMLLDEAAGSDQRDHVYLSDFGLSKQSLAAADLTSAGQFLGTLDYVAPEQIEGRPVDGRADLYALACAAFEMLCGTPPFNRDQRMAVLWAQLSEPPPALTARRPDLPSAIDQVMAKALAKSPPDRYASCHDFAAALRAASGLGAGEAAAPGVPPSPAAASPRPARAARQATELAMPTGTGGTAAARDHPGTEAAGANVATPSDTGGVGTGGAGTGTGTGTGTGDATHPGTEVAPPAPTEGTDSDTAPDHPGTEAVPAAPVVPPVTVVSPVPAVPVVPPVAAGPPTGTAAGIADLTAATGAGRDATASTGAEGSAGTAPGAGESAAAEPSHVDAGPYRGPTKDAGSPSGRPPAGAGTPVGQGPPGPPPMPFPAPHGKAPGRRRPRKRSRAALVVACAAVAGLAGAAFAIHATGTGTHGAALTLPGCTTATAAARSLANVHSATVSLPGEPYAVAVTPDGQWSFVTLGNSVAVLRNGGSLAPSFAGTTIPVPSAAGESVTQNGRNLLVASGSGAAVIDVASAEQGSPDAVLGSLSAPGGSGADQVFLSPDDRFAFVTLASSGQLAVFNLQNALASGFGPASFVGSIRLGVKPAGMRVSPDGRWLYVVTGMRNNSSHEGTLTVINLRRAETNPAASVAATVSAGCAPVRVIVSADGSVVWVTASLSDAVLGFSTAKVLSDPRHSLIARVPVGEAPIGLTFVDHEKRIVVANSNVFRVKGATASLGVINTSAALAGLAMLGVVQTGRLPRQFTVEGGTLLVTNSGSRQLQAVSIGDLP